MDDWFSVTKDHIYISIYLEADYPPDPVHTTDYVALGLLFFYVLYTFVFNVGLACIAARWKFVQSINIPLVYAMSFFSMCHMICIFLDMSYVRELTEYVQSVSCVATAYWGEYCLGLCGFMAVLGVRVYSLLMVSVDLLRPKGARYRRTLLKSIFFMMFLLPIYGLCLLVTVDNEAEYNELLSSCETPNAYKFSVVGILVFYMIALTTLALWLTKTDINPTQASPILNIITLAVPLLVLSCAIHFGFMLPHHWGRFAFMCTAFTLHFFSYVRITSPVLVEYWKSNRAELNSVNIPELDPVTPRMPVSEQFYTESTLKMSDDVKWIMSILEGRRCKLTSEVLLRFPEIRRKFFNRCKAGCVDDMATFRGEELQEVHYFEEDEDNGMPIYRLITFFDDINTIHTLAKTVYSTSVYHNDKIVGKLAREKITELWKTFLAPHSKMPVNIPSKLTQRILEGFKHPQVAEWDCGVLMQLMVTILDFLIFIDDGIFSGEFDEIVYEMCEKYGEKIDAMDAENIIDLVAEVTNVSTTSHFNQLLDVLRAGPGELHARRGDVGKASVLELEDDLYGDSFDMRDDIREVDFGEPTPHTDERVVDDHLPDGSIRYTSPSRAAAFFVYDVGVFFYNAPGLILASCRDEIQPRSLFSEEVILVDN